MTAVESNFVSVIIPVYNDWGRLASCIECLKNQSFQSDCFEIIVVDNGSTSTSQGFGIFGEHVTILVEESKGSYAARNCGLERAKGDIVAFTDSDCLPDKDWLKNGVAELTKIGRKGMVAGKIEVFSKYRNKPTSVELYDSVFGFDQKRYMLDSHYGATANMMVWREAFSEIGVFDKALYSGGDKQWGLRAWKAGYDQVYVEGAVVEHPARRTLREHLVKVKRVTHGKMDIASGPNGKALLSESKMYTMREKFSYICSCLKRLRWHEKIRVLYVLGLTQVYKVRIYTSTS
ncbi:MAG: glycosyltransferase family A protein [Pseudomonadales bacterium]